MLAPFPPEEKIEAKEGVAKRSPAPEMPALSLAGLREGTPSGVSRPVGTILPVFGSILKPAAPVGPSRRRPLLSLLASAASQASVSALLGGLLAGAKANKTDLLAAKLYLFVAKASA